MVTQTRVLIISHALVVPENQLRWQMLAMDKDYDVHILIPQYWEQNWFGEKITYRNNNKTINNLNVHCLPTTSTHKWGKYFFKSIDCKFRTIRPDLIYIIHEESVWVHHQVYICKKLFVPRANVIFFSMNARGVPYQICSNPFKKIILKLLWYNIIKNTDAALVHYPGCVVSLRKGGYMKPIFIQTQVGVNEDIFKPCDSSRLNMRKKLGFDNKCVIGFCGRLVPEKGVDDLLYVFIKLAQKYEDIALLLVGNGDLKHSIEEDLKKHHIQNTVHITGFVYQAEVPNYMNAMDVLVLGSKTMPHWIDTFPLVTVQAQATKVPVIASDSASIPWQLADSAKIFKEGDKEELSDALDLFINDRELRGEYARKGQKRSHENFCHEGMTEIFKKIVGQVMSGEFVYHEKNEHYIQWKAY